MTYTNSTKPSTMKTKILTCVLLLVFHFNSNATHIVGARIYTTHITGNQYSLTLELYRDCSGINGSSSASVNVSTGGVITLPLRSSNTVLDSCSSIITTCVSPMGFIPGYERLIYDDTIVINSATTFTFTQCCLSGSITNLASTGSYAPYTECYLDPAGSNSSAELNNINQFYRILLNNTISLDFNVYDEDSLAVVASPIFNGNSTTLVPFATGCSLSNPRGGSGYNVSIDGFVDMGNGPLGQQALGYKVESYRNGVLNGSQLFYMVPMFALDAASNPTIAIPPTQDLVDLTTSVAVNSRKPIPVVAGQQYKYILDVNTNAVPNNTSNTYFSIPNGMTISPGSGNNPIDTLTWTPSVSASGMMEVLDIKVKDDQCSVGGYVEREKYHFQILPTAVVDSVWPGDVDWNLTVDISDPIMVGVAYGMTGTTRPNASTNWIGQAATDWATNFSSGLNHKHADCNGDGTVDSTDLLAINANWANNHQKDNSYKTTSTLAIYPTSANSDNTEFEIALGEPGDLANDVYGITMDLQILNKDGTSWHNWTSEPVGFDFGSSWLSQDLLPFYQPTSQQSIKLALTKKDHIASSGQGHLFKINLDPSVASDYAQVSIENAIIYGSDGDVIDTIEGQSAIFDITAVSKLNTGDLKIYPNPNHTNSLNIDLGSHISDEIRIDIYNVLGQKVYHQKLPSQNGEYQLNHRDLSPGNYLIRISSDRHQWQTLYEKL